MQNYYKLGYWKGLLCLLYLILILINKVSAQGDIFEEKVKFINNCLKGIYEIKIQRKRMIIKCLKDNRIARRETAYLADLDPDKVEYNKKENTIVLNCRDRKSVV